MATKPYPLQADRPHTKLLQIILACTKRVYNLIIKDGIYKKSISKLS